MNKYKHVKRKALVDLMNKRKDRLVEGKYTKIEGKVTIVLPFGNKLSSTKYTCNLNVCHANINKIITMTPNTSHNYTGYHIL